MAPRGPADYQTADGSRIPHVGEKKLVACTEDRKLCLWLAEDPVVMLNRQNLAGNTAMHYAFQYGFDQLGEYLVSKRGSDVVANNRGLSCRQGTEEGSAAAPTAEQQQQPPPATPGQQQQEEPTYAI